MSAIIHTSTLDFLKRLSKNNNRDWFNAHKDQYIAAQENMIDFVEALKAQVRRHDHIAEISSKKSLYRIYSDVRFSKDKSPYKPRFAGYIRRVKPMLRGGYYFWIKPGGSHIACGFSYPNPEDLQRTRMDILDNYKEWNKILNQKSIKSTFGKMQGEQVKTAPKGFPKDHPAIDLLRYKQYWFECSFTDKEVLAKDFLNNVNKKFKSIRPFFDHMSEVLTTNLNGESIA